MARKAITTEFYDALVAAFRESPGNANRAAATVKERLRSTCDYRTAKRAWTEGWPDKSLRPIRDVLRLEELEARAKAERDAREREATAIAEVAENESEAREAARRDAIRARAQESVLVRAARDNVLALLDSTKELLGGYREIAPKVIVAIEGAVDEMDPVQALEMLRTLASTARAATLAGRDCLAMERLLLGQPTEILGIKDMDAMGENDALREIEEAAAAARRFKERKDRRLRLVHGGASTSSG